MTFFAIMRRWGGLMLLLLAAGHGFAESPAPSETSPQMRGRQLFQRHCVLCHGVNADGKGAMAGIMKPPPANLTVSAYPEGYKRNIIREGGESVGRSTSMPPWGKELTAAQIDDLVAYLESIKLVRD